jgi:lipopolysaccharide export system protein LptC
MTAMPDTEAPAARANGARRIGERLASIVPLPRRRHSAGYSRFVVSMKIALPAAAVALLLALTLWSHVNTGESRFAIPKVVVKPDDLENLRMEAPRYVGVDERNQPFLVTARLAAQSASGEPLTQLEEPKGDIALANGTWIAMEAQRGVYDRRAEALELSGAVTLFQDRGYQLHTESARFQFRPGTAEGDAPVRGQGPDLEMEAAGFRIEDKGARIFLRGQSRILSYARRPAEAAGARSRP